MIEIDVALYLETEMRLALLEKRITLPVLPRLGECIKFVNSELGDYFSFTVEQITHRENGIPEIWATGRQITEMQTKPSYWHEEDFDGDVATYVKEGWQLKTCHPKKKTSQPEVAPNRNESSEPG